MKSQARNYTMSKKKKDPKNITMLEPTSEDSTSAKSLAQFKRGLDVYMDNGNSGS